MTDIDLDALEATARAATPSEWHVEGSKFHDSYGHGLGQTFGIYWRSNAEYIAALDPPTALALITRLREAEACIEDIAAMHVKRERPSLIWASLTTARATGTTWPAWTRTRH